VVVVAREPVLIASGDWTTTLYGHPGTNCAIEYTTNLLDPGWTPCEQLTLTNKLYRFNVLSNQPALFFRAYELQRPSP
jgi:hypothetical protein